MSRLFKFEIGFIGETSFDTNKGFERFVEDNKEHIISHSLKYGCIILDDNVRITKLSNNPNLILGFRLDQVILHNCPVFCDNYRRVLESSLCASPLDESHHFLNYYTY